MVERAVKAKSAVEYQKELDLFITEMKPGDLAKADPDVIDGYLAHYFERRFFRGDDASRGNKVVAALMHRAPAYGKMGSKTMKRSITGSARSCTTGAKYIATEPPRVPSISP